MSLSRDVAIEYAHCRLVNGDGEYEHPDTVASSAQYARDLQDFLAVAGYTSTVQILVDDKYLQPGEDATPSLAALRRDCEAELPPDCVVLESGLVGLLEQFLADVVNSPSSNRVRRAVDRYRNTHGGALACSQDIALWHSLRLGRLSPQGLAQSTTVAGPPLDGRLYQCRLAVSILQDRDAQHEEAADHDLLSRVGSIDPTRQLLRYYLPEDGKAGDVSSERWRTFRGCVLDNLTADGVLSAP